MPVILIKHILINNTAAVIEDLRRTAGIILF